MFNPNQMQGRCQDPAPLTGPPRRLTPADLTPSLLPAARDYHRRGFCPIPQRPGEKMPYVQWIPYQDARPSIDDLESWFLRQFPDAGIALVLGPAFDLFVVDVDGEDAHRALVARLGRVPETPTVLSGSAKPFKEHFYFKHPDVPTQATFHPWHPQLEFRGYRGIVVAPPSLHKSGNRYRWADGKSLDDLPLPEAPEPILEALSARAAQRTGLGRLATTAVPPKPVQPESSARERIRSSMQLARLDPRVSRKTIDFLRGVYADEPGWNNNIYNAACDLAGCDVDLDDALPLLLDGAAPWTAADREAAGRTIRSAYGHERLPARERAEGRGDASSGSFVVPIHRHESKEAHR